MNWYDWFNMAAGASSLMGLILAAILGVVSWLAGERCPPRPDDLLSSGSTVHESEEERLLVASTELH
jgi:hypothetical protein